MAPIRTTAYRYPNEQLILTGTVLLVLLVIAFTAAATVCLSVLFVLGFVALAYSSTRNYQRLLMRSALPVQPATAPGLAQVARRAAVRLQVEPVQVYIVNSRQLNAYTFGLSSPKSIVLYSALVNLMDPEEMQFVIGHEMGHVVLGHTWLNSLIGGMAGIPSPTEASLLLALAFRSWNRACEFSADRAGLLACGNPQKAISALVKLQAGPNSLSPMMLERALRTIEAEDDNHLAELISTHPILIHRINQLRSYAASSEYQRLKALMDRNMQAA